MNAIVRLLRHESSRMKIKDKADDILLPEKKNYISLWTTAIIVSYFLLSYLGIEKAETLAFFNDLPMNAEGFFQQAFIIGIFVYLLFWGFYLMGFKPNLLKASIVIITISCSMALLITIDKSIPTSDIKNSDPDSFYGFLYSFMTQHHALLLLIILMIFFIGVAIYYLIRNVFVIQFSSSGIHLQLPGQTLYYLPVFPQLSWQDTGINIEKGKKYRFELSGYVSPGVCLNSVLLDAKIAENKCIKEKGNYPCADYDKKINWPYTGPEGYPTKYYSEEMPPVMQQDVLYQQKNFYMNDQELTVRGMTHNKVIGFIKGEDDPDDEPHAANMYNNIPGYDWNNTLDKEKLICLSKVKYPYILDAKKSGKLYVVINDVDRARWDNAGMFFLKVTKKSF